MRITRFLHSRYAVAAAMLVAAAGAWYVAARQPLVHIGGDKGVVFPSANEWIASEQLSLWLSLAVNLGVVALMVFINRTYNVLRSVTMLYASLFPLMQLATPDLLAQFYSGTVMAAVLMVCCTLVFATFGNASAPSRRVVFLVFGLLSAGAATQYCYIFYLPVFVAACAQMRILTLRTVVAAVLGIVTPWWIIFGLGIVSPRQVHLPHMASIFGDINSQETVLLLVTVAFTAFVAFAGWALCFMKMMSYNARTRSCNGVLTLMLLMSVAAMAFDYTNIVAYIPTLNICAAMQVAHFFAMHRRERSWIAILSVMAVYLVFYLCRIAI